MHLIKETGINFWIKIINHGHYLSILETGYPKGLYWIENNGGKEYISIDSRKETTIKKHDCKEAAVLYLLDLMKGGKNIETMDWGRSNIPKRSLGSYKHKNNIKGFK